MAFQSTLRWNIGVGEPMSIRAVGRSQKKRREGEGRSGKRWPRQEWARQPWLPTAGKTTACSDSGSKGARLRLGKRAKVRRLYWRRNSDDGGVEAVNFAGERRSSAAVRERKEGECPAAARFNGEDEASALASSITNPAT